MAVHHAKDVAAALIAKGMTRDENHHEMFRKEVRARPTDDDDEPPPVIGKVVTRISHGAKEIDEGLGKLMARQCRLALGGFNRLVSCEMSAEEWDDIIRSQGGKNPYFTR